MGEKCAMISTNFDICFWLGFCLALLGFHRLIPINTYSLFPVKMSTRWYPIYQKGNPQLRIFLPNFWMKLVKMSQRDYPKNIIHFHCSKEMTNVDVKNYLEKIYKIPVVEVHTQVVEGKLRRCPGRGYIIKDDDVKLAKVIMPKMEKFVFPNVFPKTEYEEEKKQLDDSKKDYQKNIKNPLRLGVPNWYSF